MLIPWFQREVSIEECMGEEGGNAFEARLVDHEAESQEQKIYRKEVTGLVRDALVKLNERELHIIRNRFGLLGGQENSLDEIAAALNLSRERVRQLEQVAKFKLRKSLSRCFPSPLPA
jgi:RNA polymerase sigma factor (sigma-70 family)